MRLRLTAELAKTLVLWALWQCFVLFALGIAFVNVFTEYGWFPDSPVAPYAAVVFLVVAFWVGSWVPMKRWRRAL